MLVSFLLPLLVTPAKAGIQRLSLCPKTPAGRGSHPAKITKINNPMIQRYSRETISRVWSDENKYKTWLIVETAVLQAREEAGLIPPGVTADVRDQADFSVARIEEIEAEVHHDVIAFITNIGEHIGENSQHFHQGLTSSDVLDTALALQIKKASAIILEGMESFSRILAEKAVRYKETPCIGRSHGVHAEPVTFGLKLAGFFAEMQRGRERFNRAVEDVGYGKTSGAVGTYSLLPPEIESRTMEILDLKPDPISTQIVQRDRHAYYLATVAAIGGTLERIALEIRHLSRTEVREVEEPFGKKQRGSSAMPHKKNPIICENICGLARLLRSNAMAAMENQALWHERDISHSSVERVVFPDSTVLLDYMLFRLSKVISGLNVYPENMLKNLDLTGGTIYSQNVLNALLDKGFSRDQAYTMVQKCALESRNTNTYFKTILMNDTEISQVLSQQIIDACFKVSLKHVNTVFARLGLN